MMTVSTIQGYVDRQGSEVKNKTDSRQDGCIHEIVMAWNRHGAVATRKCRRGAGLIRR